MKYCGFLFNTEGIPTLKIPEDKKDRASAMIQHVLSSPRREWSRLSLAVVGGVLESMAEGTPRRIGHTYLKSLQGQIRPPESGTGIEPYLTKTRLGQRSLRELQWWARHLRDGHGRIAWGTSAGTLTPAFGDGSGTGTGGTFILPNSPLRMWKGKWVPCVYSHSSNLKELGTLHVTLEVILSESSGEVRGCTLFYFTDNSTTYWICSKGSSRNSSLHRLLEEIRALEVQLECHLVVIHVPGLIMIQEGTDGLSRGLWISPWHPTILTT